jgi:hypothetical protein
MKVIRPFDLSDPAVATVTTNLVESNPLWVSGTTYGVNALVYYDAVGVHRTYQRIIAGAGTTTPNLDTANWADIGPNNKWAMFDNSNSTSSTGTSFLTTIVIPDLFSTPIPSTSITAVSIAMFGLVCGNVTITWYALDGVTIAGTSSIGVNCWTDKIAGSNIVHAIPLNPGYTTKITVSVSGSYGSGSIVAKCATLVLGELIYIGDTMYNPTIGIVSYSVKQTDSYGNTTFVKRSNSKRMTAKLMLNNAQLSAVQGTLAQLEATPCVWLGTDTSNLSILNVFGFSRDFSFDVAYPTRTLCSLDIEGLA